ncbi:MAG TPA: hypothetical protein VFQ41_09310 [Candidatus Angelobacter sp.]|nr:hypothetical protein [Candidatus Angelobacter sp.]
MKNYLSTVDLAMWVAIIVGKLFLCLCILKKRFYSRLPWFSALIFAYSVKSFLLLALAYWARYATYYYTFYIGGYIESALVLLTLIECGRQILPGLNLPQREKAFAWLGASLAAVLIFTVVWPLPSIAQERRIEVGAYLGIAAVFIFIAAYSRYLGLYWSRLLAGITATLGLLYLVEGVTGAMIGHYPSALVALVREIRQIANILAVIAWIVVILSPWGEREMTEQDLKKIEAAFARIEASVGAGGR